jgi:hypothetical protein
MLPPPRFEAPSPHPDAHVTYEQLDDKEPAGGEDEAWLAGALGLVSVIALSASFLWAHHWGPLAYTIVGVWIVSTLGALILGVRTLRLRGVGRALALLAMVCVCLSALAVLTTGVAFAAGYDPTGLCGGG